MTKKKDTPDVPADETTPPANVPDTGEPPPKVDKGQEGEGKEDIAKEEKGDQTGK